MLDPGQRAYVTDNLQESSQWHLIVMIMTLNHPALAETCTIMSVVQIGYSTVFFFEYLGPMLIYPLFFLFPSVFYGKYVLAAGQSVSSSATVALRSMC